jgi:hypothetical protein
MALSFSSEQQRNVSPRFTRSASLAASALALQACAGIAPVCPVGLGPMVEARLFFGDEIPGGGAVTAGQWQEFLDSEVTPGFPAGLSVLATDGQWRRPDDSIVRESGHEVLIVFVRTPADEAKLDEIRRAYMRRFQQESVLLTESSVCAAF